MRRMHAVHEEDFLIVLQGFLELLVPHDPRFLRLAVGLGGNADWFVICEAVLFQPLRQTAYAVRDAERFLHILHDVACARAECVVQMRL